MKMKNFFKTAIFAGTLAVGLTAAINFAPSVDARNILDLSSLERSDVFKYYNPYGTSDTAVYQGKYITLDDVRDNYNVFIKLSDKKYYNPLTGYNGVEFDCSTEAVPVIRYRVDSPLCAFIPKDAFTTIGDNAFIGDEYGYYVRTEIGYVANGSRSFYRNQVLLFDIDYSSTGTKFETTIEVVAACETYTYAPDNTSDSSVPGTEFYCYGTDTYDTHNRMNDFIYSGLRGDLAQKYYYTVPAINVKAEPRLNNPRKVFIGDLSYTLDFGCYSQKSDNDMVTITRENCVAFNHTTQKSIEEASKNAALQAVGPLAFATAVAAGKLVTQDYAGAAFSFIGAIFKETGKAIFKVAKATSDFQSVDSARVDVPSTMNSEAYQKKQFNGGDEGSAYPHSAYSLIAENFLQLPNAKEKVEASSDNNEKRSILALNNIGDKLTITIKDHMNNFYVKPRVLIGCSFGLFDMKSHGSFTNYSNHCDFIRRVCTAGYASNSRLLPVCYKSNEAKTIKDGVISPNGAFMVRTPGNYEMSNGSLGKVSTNGNFSIYGYPISLDSSKIYIYEYDDSEKKAKVKNTFTAHYYMRVLSDC